MQPALKRVSVSWALLGLGVLCALVSLWGLKSGPVKIAWEDMFSSLLLFFTDAENDFSLAEGVFFNIRLPRVLLGLAVGAVLSLAGASMQSLFRNPLADPGLLGVATGAACGAVTYMVLLQPLVARAGIDSPYFIALAAVLGATGATVLACMFAQSGGRIHIVTLLLVGIAINAIGGAYTGFLLFLADDNQLRSVTFWMMGSLGSSTWTKVGPILPLLALLGGYVLTLGRPMNAMACGDDTAFHLGFDVKKLQRVIIVVSSALVGATVALCGIIGFIGLVVPHLARTLFGADNRKVLPFSALLGALLLTAADLISRNVVSPAELPIGIVTSLLGGPFFLALLLSAKKRLFGV